MVVSPFEQKISLLAASYTTASTPPPIGSVAITLPVLISTTLMPLFSRQPVNTLWLTASSVTPVGPPQGARGYDFITFIVLVSITSSMFLSSMLLYTSPLPSDTANSGPPPRSTVVLSFSVLISITEAAFPSPQSTSTFFDQGSYIIPSGPFGVTGMVVIVLKVVRSNTTTELSLPSLINPLFTSLTTAMPCTPFMLSIEPITFSVARSIIFTEVPCETNRCLFTSSIDK